MQTRLTPLGELADIRTGHTFRGAQEHDPAGVVRVLQIRDLRHSREITPENLIAIGWEARTAPQLLEAGDVVLVARGDSNTAALYRGGEPTVATSQFFILSLRRQDILPEYLCWILNHPQTQRSVERSGTSIQAISKAALLEMPIPLPALQTQQQLIGLQRVWDEEDQLIARLQNNRQQMLQGIYQQLTKA